MTNSDRTAHVDYIRDQRRDELARQQRTWRKEWLLVGVTLAIVGLASLWMVNKASAQELPRQVCQGVNTLTGEPFGCVSITDGWTVQPLAPQRKPVNKKLYAAFLGMDALNETLTLVNMHRGFHELNPAYPSHNIAGHIATFAAFQALDYYALKRLEKWNPTVARVMLYSLIGVQGFVTSWEVRNLHR